MKPRTEALIRLLAVQASYTYERMAGIGVGHASAPLLRDVFALRSARERREAVARSADFFNSHPYLAGVAVGAEVRAEQQGIPGPVITRLRTALSGPLGALGDQLRAGCQRSLAWRLSRHRGSDCRRS
jgi:PTS system mannose-specific IID component